MRGMGRIYRRGDIWWIQYSFRGAKQRESTRSTERADAVRLLRRRLEELSRGRLAGPNAEKTTFEELAVLLMDDYAINGRRSRRRVGFAVARLKRAFAGLRATDLTTERFTRYVLERQTAGAANATINRELAAVRRMLRLAQRAGRVDAVPHIPMLREDNVRKGFFEPEQFQAIRRELPPYLQPVVTAAYITGWRVASELLTRCWAHVDFAGGWLRLEPGETKNGEGRQFPLIPELRAVLQAQRQLTETLQRTTGSIIPWVFHREGEPIKDFRGAWKTACRRVGLPGRIPHDFRRTAVRNLERAGVPRSVAMKLVGHRTESVYRRYAIVAESDLQAGGERLAAFQS